MINQTYLQITWSVSRGAETYGYNIARLDDTNTGKRYRCMGGGYDMTGTVFGEWLMDVYGDRLMHLAVVESSAHGSWHWNRTTGQYDHTTREAGYYGLSERTDENNAVHVRVDGGCGLSSMERIAEAIGLSVRHLVNRRGQLTGMIVTESAEVTS